MTRPKPDRPVDCMIAGAGHAGLALARLLADRGVRVALIDRRADPRDADRSDAGRPAGWGLSVNLGGVTALRTAGLWPYLAEDAQPLAAMRVIDPVSHREVLYEAAESGSEALSWGIGGQHLADGLYRAVADQPVIDVIWGEDLVGCEADDDGCRLICRSGRTVAGRLAIAADGRGSPLRRAAGLDGPTMDFRQVALTVGVATERSHYGEGFEVLLPGGPLAFLPLPERRGEKPSAAVTWVLSKDKAAHWQAAGDDAVAGEIRRHMPDRLGGVRSVTPVAAFPLSFSHARRLVGRRLALVGDAAHGLHPIHAQGFNLALRDVARLAEILVAEHRGGRDLGSRSLLQRYQATRLPDTVMSGLFTTGFSLASSSTNPLARGAVGAGALLLKNLPILRQALMRQGRGEFPGRPQLLRGIPL